ncbi:MAG: XRE family transcriptional regulator [Myxococcales bacterium]|nr:XRE family transcriptional regulator [Myxococcales bacterium]
MRPSDPERVVGRVGRRVAELRVARDLTQEQLAEKLGVSLKYLQRIEAGRENLTIESMVRLANVLSRRVIDLFRPPRRTVRRKGRPPSR